MKKIGYYFIIGLALALTIFLISKQYNKAEFMTTSQSSMPLPR